MKRFPLFLFFLSQLAVQMVSAEDYRVESGYLDLHAYTEDSPIIELDGEWDFLNGELANPDDTFIYWPETRTVPGNIVFSQNRKGFGTLHLSIYPPQEGLYAIYFPEISSACRIYVNGNEVQSSGIVGNDWLSEIKDNNEILYPLEIQGNQPIHILIHFSNYNGKRSGPIGSIRFGDYIRLNRFRQLEVMILIGIIGAFLMIGFYHLTLFLFRRKEQASLYFSLLTFFLAGRIFFIRLMGIADIFQILDFLPYVFYKRIGYMNFYAAFVAFCFFYQSIFSEKRYLRMARISLYFSLVTALPVLFTPFLFFSRFVLVNQIVIIVFGVYYMTDLIFKAVNKDKEAWIFLIAFGQFYLTIVIDIFKDMLAMASLPVAHIGFLLFVMIQGVLLSRRYSFSYTSSESLTRDLNRLFTERKSYEKLLESRVVERTEALIQAMEEADVANRAKGEFLARMSHEIRTPLNGIMGFGEIISELDDEAEADKYSELIISESEKLLELINQLLDLSRIDSGEIVLEIRPTDLDQFYLSVTTLFAPRIRSAGLEFHSSIPEFGYLVLCDPFRLRQILINLLGNALKFTSEGQIQLDVEIVQESDEQVSLVTVVSDTGIGIDLKSQDKIFDEFQQGDSSITRKYGGTGLGTTIARSLVEKMGGEIGVKSRLGEGSSFWFLLPLKKLERPETFSREQVVNYSYDSMNLSVLLVDDSETNRMVAAHHLTEVGCRVDQADNGQDALDAFSRNRYDLVFMDVHMPEMDGFETARKIRKLPGGDVVIILGLTADAFNETKVRCLQSGMNDVITKPLKKKTFLQTVGRWMGEEGQLEFSDL